MVAVPDYLLVRGKSPENAVDALAVAADMDAVSEEVQVDIATTGNLVDYLEVGGAVRRVVGIDAPDIEEIKGLNFFGDGRGLGEEAVFRRQVVDEDGGGECAQLLGNGGDAAVGEV